MGIGGSIALIVVGAILAFTREPLETEYRTVEQRGWWGAPIT